MQRCKSGRASLTMKREALDIVVLTYLCRVASALRIVWRHCAISTTTPNSRSLGVYFIAEGIFSLSLPLQLLAYNAPTHDTRSAPAPVHIRRNRLRALRPYTCPSTSAMPLLQHRDPYDREAVTAMAVRCPRTNREMYYVRDKRRADK
jgi:hypothetical protein